MIEIIESCLSEQKGTLVFPVYEGESVCKTVMSKMNYDFKDEVNKEYQTLSKVTTLHTIEADSVYVLSLGKREEMNETRLLKAFGVMAKTLKEQQICVALPKAVCETIDLETVARLCAEAVVCGTYEFTKINAEKKEVSSYSFKGNQDLKTAIHDGVLVGEAINHARDLGNMPSNMMYPEKLADYAVTLSKELNLKCEIFDNKALEKLGAGGILGVNKGSYNEARLIVIEYNGAGNEPYTALVGKGLTFDSGGYNLKPSGSIEGMKFDMCGGAAVLGAFELIARRGVKTNVYAVVPATENKISGNAYTCDDVLVSLSGKTVEITNTDAEGRLILMDAITYAQRTLKASRIVDAATLTGACVMALGHEFTGVFSNDEDFYNEFNQSALTSHEETWRLPLSDAFTKIIRKSSVADIVNSVPRSTGAGASTAACFLREFIEEGTSWIHLDIAGTAYDTVNDLGPNGATGVMVKSIANLFK